MANTTHVVGDGGDVFARTTSYLDANPNPHSPPSASVAPVVGITTAAVGTEKGSHVSEAIGTDAAAAAEEKKKDEPPKVVPFTVLLRYIPPALGSFLKGACWPMWSLLFGEAISAFSKGKDPVHELEKLAAYFTYTAIAAGVGDLIAMVIVTPIGTRAVLAIQEQYLKSILRQEVAWHEEVSGPALDQRAIAAWPELQAALTSKYRAALENFSMGVTSFIIALVFSWKLTLVFLAVIPVQMAFYGAMDMMVRSSDGRQAKLYENAARVAHETLTLIRVIITFGTHKPELERYSVEIDNTARNGYKGGFLLGFVQGMPEFISFCMYALAFWFGSRLLRDGELDGTGDIMIVLFCCIIGAAGIGQCLGNYAQFRQGQAKARTVFDVIERESQIDGLSTSGVAPESFIGDVEFRDIRFAYPTTPDRLILDGFSGKVPHGKTCAIVGPSGSGKSTVISLLVRAYDALGGQLLIDNIPLQDYNVQWLRQHVGLVTQMPTLLPFSIGENIAMGKKGATQKEVEDAARLANAHDFISSLPEKYNTVVGTLGNQLSGGQRQRIAIARTMVGQPRILLLDEATSALDNHSETIVQRALDQARAGRTTIVIAHRLSTIQDADEIVFVDGGKVVERGDHATLVALQGRYWRMLQEQNVSMAPTTMADTPDDGEEKLPHQPVSLARVSADDVKVGLADTIELPTVEDLAGNADKPTDFSDITNKMARDWLWKWAKPDIPVILCAIVGALVIGGVWPTYSFILSNVLKTLLYDNTNQTAINKWCLAFVGLAFANLIGWFGRYGLSHMVGERVTQRIRRHVFEQVIHQPAAWHDLPVHETGKITQILSGEVVAARNMGIEYMSLLLALLVLAGAGVGTAFGSCWSEALVVLAIMPLIASSVFVVIVLEDSHKKANKTLQPAALHLTSTLTYFRVILTLGRSQDYLDQYKSYLDAARSHLTKQIPFMGVIGFFGQFLLFGGFAIAFYAGGRFVDGNHCSFTGMFDALGSIMFSGLFMGIWSSQLPNYEKGQQAVKKVMHLLRSMNPLPQISDHGGVTVGAGEIEFRNVTFYYPSRPTTAILKNFNIKIKAGESCAFVGGSGSGKSTILLLLQGMYKPTSGQILVDGVDIQAAGNESLSSYRSQIAIVDQEPKLFDRTIRENIAYSVQPELPPTDVIVRAAQLAKAHEFIMEQVNGYDTKVGGLGGRVSGGQRQRIAIARAFLHPDRIKIILLDEATSALDAESEAMIQETVEVVSKGRTSVTVAHRLSTIQNATSIHVMDNGVLLESGTHGDLLAKRGAYFNLYSKSLSS